MVKITSVKKFLFLVVALILCATVVFAACSTGDFTPLKDKPSNEIAESNGGVAVKYGDWLYYINGYTSDASADNTYSNDVLSAPRIGSVVRIKLADIEALFELSEAELDEDDEYKTVNEKVAAAVRGELDDIDGVETVVPKIYISSNSSETRLTGLYIFDDRIYITTPNDELTAAGNTRTDELVLMSFDLNGANPRVHFNFGGSDGQIWMGKVEGKLVATYTINSKLYYLDVAEGKETLIELNDPDNSYDFETVNDVSGVVWDLNADCTSGNVFYINSIGEICKLALGATEYEVMVANDVKDITDGTVNTTYTYTIKGVNNGQVYYTKSDKDESNKILYWADSDNNDIEDRQIALNSNRSDAVVWKDGYVVYSISKNGYYGLNITGGEEGKDGNDQNQIVVLPREDYEESIKIDRIVGDTLYYTSNNVAYTLNLNKALAQDEDLEITPYGTSLSSGTGWTIPDFVKDGDVQYVITASSNSVSIVKFDSETKKNSEKSVDITLKAAA